MYTLLIIGCVLAIVGSTLTLVGQILLFIGPENIPKILRPIARFVGRVSTSILGLFRTDTVVPILLRWILSSSLFVVLVFAYVNASNKRHAENPQDKLMPTISKMIDGFNRVAFKPDRKGEYRLWSDFKASAYRFSIGMAIAVTFGTMLGLYTGALPIFEAVFPWFKSFVHKVPALSLLPLIFIYCGTDEFAKIFLIVFSILPVMALDAYQRVKAIPKEQFYKAQSLGATEAELINLVIFPQILPMCINTARLCIGPALLLLIAAEGIAAEAGMGYRIFVVRRYVAVDIIIPYVIIMTGISFFLDLALHWIVKQYRWVDK